MEVVSKRIVEIDLESSSSHGHRDESLPIVSKLKPIVTRGFLEPLERLRTRSTRDKMNRAATVDKQSSVRRALTIPNSQAFAK